MSEQQRQVLDAILRGGPLNLAADLAEQRQVFEKMAAGHPLPADVRTSLRELGGVPAITVEIEGTVPAGTVLYFHGGAYVIGSAQSSLGLAAEIARRAGVRVVTVDYRLAPENPYPAALDDALAAYRALLAETEPGQIAVAGESAGGGLAIALLVAARDTGLPMPASGAVFSPFADLTLAGGSIAGKSSADPALTEAGLRLRGGQYIAAGDPATPTASPVFASLKGLPSLLIQAELLDEAEAALDEAGRFIAASVRR